MTWAYVLFGTAGVAFLAIVAVLLFAKRWLADRPHPEPEPHRIPGRPRSEPAEATTWRTFTDTVPHIRLAALAEQAAEANTELAGGEHS